MLRVHDTSAAHSAVYKELGMEKYDNERILTDGKQDVARKVRRKSDVWLTTGRKEGIQRSQGLNCQGRGILVLVAGIPNSDTDQLI